MGLCGAGEVFNPYWVTTDFAKKLRGLPAGSVVAVAHAYMSIGVAGFESLIIQWDIILKKKDSHVLVSV